MRQRRQISTQTTVAKCIMYQNNESHLCLLTFWGCCLHFAALCINTHGFNNLGSGVVIDPVGHSPPFLISSSSAWGSVFPMSLHIYILQHNHECREVNGHKLYHACLAQHHQLEMIALHAPNNMEEIRLQSANGSLLYTLWLFNSWKCSLNMTQSSTMKQAEYGSLMLE